MLNITEFIQITQFGIDKDTFDRFYHNLQDDIPIYLNKNIIKWCGYEGDLRHQKEQFIKIINSNDIPIIELNNTEYVEFYGKIKLKQSDKNSDTNSEITDIDYSTLYPDPKTFNSKAHKTKHILIMPDDFKKVVIMLKTKKGNRIRDHFINLCNLLELYWMYQCKFYKKSYDKDIKNLKQMQHIKEYTKLKAIQELEEYLNNKYKIGCIYFIHEDNNYKYAKIGYTYNLKKRLQELQIGNMRKLYVYKSYYISFPQIEESRLHNLYNLNKVKGEWFKLNLNDIFKN